MRLCVISLYENCVKGAVAAFGVNYVQVYYFFKLLFKIKTFVRQKITKNITEFSDFGFTSSVQYITIHYLSTCHFFNIKDVIQL